MRQNSSLELPPSSPARFDLDEPWLPFVPLVKPIDRKLTLELTARFGVRPAFDLKLLAVGSQQPVYAGGG